MELIDPVLFYELFIFAMVLTITPGANNVITFFYALRFGSVTAWRFRIGVIISFPIMSGLTAYGLLPLFEHYPLLLNTLTGASILMMTYIAYKVAVSNPDLSDDNHNIPIMGMLGSIAFQIINGKAWSMAISATSLYTAPLKPAEQQAITVWLVYLITNIICAFPWIYGGVYLRSWFAEKRRMQIFNYTMAVVIIVVAISPIIMEKG